MNTANEEKISEEEKIEEGGNESEEVRNDTEKSGNEESGNEESGNEAEELRNGIEESGNEESGNEAEELRNDIEECGNEAEELRNDIEESGNKVIQNKGKTSKSKQEPKPKKEPKPKFSLNCSKCNKLFKNELSYNKHTLEQVCYKSNEITRCKICKITLDKHNDYKKHLYSLNHINNIGCNTIEKINTSPTQTIHHLDPFLNKNDAESIVSKNLGNSFTIVFETGNTQTVNLKHNTKENTTTKENITIKENTTTKENSIKNNTILLNENQTIKPIDTTERQTKIINFLKKQISENKSIEISGITFYKMLDNKLQLEDYKGLQNIITQLDINDDYKQNYITIINNFISLLVKEKTTGKTIYKDKDISQLVINLTS